MENNLDDVLIDNFEKTPKKTNKRKILIIVASVVLLGVLGVSSIMLAKQEPAPKNLEFSELEAELEKLNPPNQEDAQTKEEEFNKFIADIKNKQAQEETQSNKTPSSTTQKDTPDLQANLDSLPKEKEKVQENGFKIDTPPEASKNTLPPKQESKNMLFSQKTQSTPKKDKSTPAVKQKEKSNLPKESKSASQLFQTMQNSIPKGYYLQVGVFGSTPQKSFLNKLKAYPYKSEKIQRSGKTLTRYLIGPYSSKEMAQSKINQVAQDISKPVIVQIR